MLLLQLQLQLQAGPRVRFVRVESPAVAADRQNPPTVGRWLSRDELQPAGEATGFRRAGMRILVLTSSLLVQRPSSLALAWTDRLQLETWQVSPALPLATAEPQLLAALAINPLICSPCFCSPSRKLRSPTHPKRDETRPRVSQRIRAGPHQPATHGIR
jgi:hypothetical protein